MYICSFGFSPSARDRLPELDGVGVLGLYVAGYTGEMSVWVVGLSRGTLEAYFVCGWLYLYLCAVYVYVCFSRDWLVCFL